MVRIGSGVSHQRDVKDDKLTHQSPHETALRQKKASRVLTRLKRRGSAQSEAGGQSFSYFSLLNDDLVLWILSFVAYAPTELDVSGTLTLASLDHPLKARYDANHEEARTLLLDYNVGAARLKKRVGAKKSRGPIRFRLKKSVTAQQRGLQSNDEPKDLGTQSSRVSAVRSFGTITHVFPLISKRIDRICKESDLLWKEALQRLLLQKNWYSDQDRDQCFNDLVERGLISFINTVEKIEKKNVSTEERDQKETLPQRGAPAETELDIDRAQAVIGKICRLAKESGMHVADECAVARDVLRKVLCIHKPTRLPVFRYRYPVKLGKQINIHLYEERYKLLIAALMGDRPEREWNSFPVSNPRPRFLFSHAASNSTLTPSAIVEVQRCRIARDGSADVSLIPTSFVLLEQMQVRPGSGSLRDAVIVPQLERDRLPVFAMRSALTLGQLHHVRLLEIKHRALITTVMSSGGGTERDDTVVFAKPYPRVVYSCAKVAAEGDVACIVEVRECQATTNRVADLAIIPRYWVMIEKVAKNLYGQQYATVVRPAAA